MKVLKWIGIGFAALVALVLVCSIFVGNDSSSGSASAPAAPAKTYGIGDTLNDGKVALIVTNIETKGSVGDEYSNTAASEGAVYVAVQYKYKNVSGSAIGMFEKPKISLYDPSGTAYEEDINATTSYSSQVGIDEKIISDLNPGITVKSCTVFEVSKELFNQTGWRLILVSDDVSFTINLK